MAAANSDSINKIRCEFFQSDCSGRFESPITLGSRKQLDCRQQFTNFAIGQIRLQNSIHALAQTMKEMEQSVHSLDARLLSMEVSMEIDSKDSQSDFKLSDLAITYQVNHFRDSLQADQATVLHETNNDGNSHCDYLQQGFCLFEQDLLRIEPDLVRNSLPVTMQSKCVMKLPNDNDLHRSILCCDKRKKVQPQLYGSDFKVSLDSSFGSSAKKFISPYHLLSVNFAIGIDLQNPVSIRPKIAKCVGLDFIYSDYGRKIMSNNIVADLYHMCVSHRCVEVVHELEDMETLQKDSDVNGYGLIKSNGCAEQWTKKFVADYCIDYPIQKHLPFPNYGAIFDDFSTQFDARMELPGFPILFKYIQIQKVPLDKFLQQIETCKIDEEFLSIEVPPKPPWLPKSNASLSDSLATITGLVLSDFRHQFEKQSVEKPTYLHKADGCSFIANDIAGWSSLTLQSMKSVIENSYAKYKGLRKQVLKFFAIETVHPTLRAMYELLCPFFKHSRGYQIGWQQMDDLITTFFPKPPWIPPLFFVLSRSIKLQFVWDPGAIGCRTFMLIFSM